MNIIGKILWKFFCATMVFFFNTKYNNAVAEGTIADPKMTKYFVDSSNETQTITICNAGYYLRACGPATLGTNWLQGMIKTKGLAEGQQITTPDYSSSIEEEDISNFRNFFHGTSFAYHIKTPNANQIADTLTTADPSEFKEFRDQILSNFCTDTNGNLVWSGTYETNGIVCAPCPSGSGNVSASTVEQDNHTGKILSNSWNINTVADCYMREFSDDTGTYVYTTDTTGTTSVLSNTGAKCYYSSVLAGTKLYYH